MDEREKILNATLKLFVEKGFHATPTSAISKKAGVSAGILFHYFPTKDDLIRTLFSEIKKESMAIIFANVDKIKSFESKLRLIWTNAWNWGLNGLAMKCGSASEYFFVPGTKKWERKATHFCRVRTAIFYEPLLPFRYLSMFSKNPSCFQSPANKSTEIL